MKKLLFLFIFLLTMVLLPSSVEAVCGSPKNGLCKSGCKISKDKSTCIANTSSGKSPATGLGSALGKLKKTTKGSGLSSNLETTLGAVIQGALSLVGTVFLILTIYAGVLWMTARGDDSQVEKSTKIIRASVIGLFLTLSAYAITFYITERLVK